MKSLVPWVTIQKVIIINIKVCLISFFENSHYMLIFSIRIEALAFI